MASPLRRFASASCVLAAIGCAAPAVEQTPSGPIDARQLLWQTNSAGDDIHIFDADTGVLVRRLDVGSHPHGLAATADHRTVFVTLEANGAERGALLWIDASSFEITRRVELCREPHALAATPDGRWLYVPCRDGQYWVVDGATGEVVRTIETGGRPHNTQISADGRWAFLSPMGSPRAVTVVDIAAGHAIVGTIPFTGAPRPSALSQDGRWLIQHVDCLNGFQAADTHERAVAATVTHGTPLDGFMQIGALGRIGMGGFSRCHGVAIRPDQHEIWSVCGDTLTIHAMAPPAFPELAHIALPRDGYWLTFSPDSRIAFAALSDSGEIAMIDTGTRTLVRTLSAGRRPKRNLVLLRLPD